MATVARERSPGGRGAAPDGCAVTSTGASDGSRQTRYTPVLSASSRRSRPSTINRTGTPGRPAPVGVSTRPYSKTGPRAPTSQPAAAQARAADSGESESASPSRVARPARSRTDSSAGGAPARSIRGWVARTAHWPSGSPDSRNAPSSPVRVSRPDATSCTVAPASGWPSGPVTVPKRVAPDASASSVPSTVRTLRTSAPCWCSRTSSRVGGPGPRRRVASIGMRTCQRRTIHIPVASRSNSTRPPTWRQSPWGKGRLVYVKSRRRSSADPWSSQSTPSRSGSSRSGTGSKPSPTRPGSSPAVPTTRKQWASRNDSESSTSASGAK